MRELMHADQIIVMPWLSPVLRQKAWDYSLAANRKSQTEENTANAAMVLGQVPEYLRDSLKQATAEESAAKDSFIEACKAERALAGLSA
jgi:hypothetical protein